MRKLLITTLFLLPVFSLAFTVPEKPTGFVQDYGGMLTTEQITALESKLQSFEKGSSNEIAVVTISSLDGDTIENIAQEIFTKWGIGKADKNNGVLFLISLTDRKTRIHTGYGVEGDLTDLETSYIQQDIVTPAFRAGNYYGGINNAVDKIIETLGGNNILPENYSKPSNIPWDFIVFIVIVFFQGILAILSRTKSWWGGGVVGGLLGLAIWHFLIASVILAIPAVIILILLGLLFDYLVSKSYTSARANGSYPWWMRGGGGGGGGSSGGGFGGFGGGSSGGGGSSSSW